MEHIGHAAWRVLQNARKAAIARNEIGAGTEMRNEEVVPGISAVNAALRPEAPATVEYPGDRKRSRHKRRSTGS